MRLTKNKGIKGKLGTQKNKVLLTQGKPESCTTKEILSQYI